MKLKVYQQGGGLIYTPFIPERWVDSSSKKESGSSSSENKIDPLDKELIDLMKSQNLLPSDIQMIYNRLIQFQRQSRDLMIDGDYRSAMPGMLQIMQLASVARANKDRWDKGLAEIKQHDAGAEVAMDSYGQMWVKDSESSKITKVSPDDFDPSKHHPISNSELMFMRERNPELAFSDDALDAITTDVVGQKDVRDEIHAIIKDFGNISKDQFVYGSKIKDIAGDVLDGDIYKIGTTYSKADLNDFSGLLFSQLSRGAQHLVRARAAMSGVDPQEYLRHIIFSETSSETDISYEASATKSAGGGSGSGGDGPYVQSTYAEHLVWGDFDEGTRTLIQPGDTDVAIYAYTQNVGPIKKDNNDFGSANLDKVFTQADVIGTIIDKGGIFFGDYKIESNDFSRIMYDNGSNMKRVELPVKDNGEIDFDAQRKADQIHEYLQRNGGMVPDDLIEEQLEDIPNAYWDREKKVVRFRNSKPFLVVEGIASSEKVAFNPDSPYIRHIEKDPNNSRKDYAEMYNNAINSGYANVQREAKKNPYNNGTSSKRHLYRANIYMPISGQVIATALYNHERLPVESYMAGTPTNMASINRDRQTVKSNF